MGGGRTWGGAPVAPVARAPRNWAWVGLLPFLAFLSLFLVLPAIAVFSKAFIDEQGNFSLEAFKDAFTGQNLDAFKFSVRLSALSAAFGVVVGAFLAYAAASIRRPKWLRSLVIAFSGVAANLGGVPLAFAFIALLGRQGLGTKILEALGYDLYSKGFQLDNTTGFIAVYSYFNIPLMVLITLPAIDGLKVAWREACANLGGTTSTYWRRIGLPVLAPSLLGGFLLLFANSFSAYATARAMTDQSMIVPLRIQFYLSGDFAGQDQLGFSLAAWMIVIMSVSMGLYWMLRKRAERWQS